MHIYNIAFFLFFQTFVACSQVSEISHVSSGDSVFHASGASYQDMEQGMSASNIIFQSADGGQTWQDISEGLPGNMQASGFCAGGTERYLRTEKGMYRSSIASTSPGWEKEIFIDDRITTILPGRGGLIAFNSQGQFFQKTKVTGIWAPMYTDFLEPSVRTIYEAADGTVFIGCDHGIFKSADKGTTWKHVLENGWVMKIVESGGVLLCTNERGILRSTDGGEHWDSVISEGGVGIVVEVIEGGFAAITYNTESETRRVRTSADGGKTWQAIDAGLPPHANIASIKQVGEYFYCGHPDGIFRSSDKGKTWELLLPSIGKKVFNLSVSGNVIYAIPLNGGC